MKIVSWNVNGIRAVLRKSLWLPFLDTVEADIICLQETKAEEDQVEQVLKSGYYNHWHSAEKKGYSGTLILSRYPTLSLELGLPSSSKLTDSEGRVITAEYQDFYLVNVYTPNAQNELRRLDYRCNEWDPNFRDHVTTLEKKKPVIICGDLNVAHKPIDLARPKANESSPGFTPQERESFSQLLSAGYDDSFRLFSDEPNQYSWWSYRANARAKNIGWRIDYFCTSQKIRHSLKSAEIHPDILGSDHCPVSLTVDQSLKA